MKAERLKARGADTCLYATESALRAWLVKAQANDRFEYANGARIDQQARVVMVARQLSNDKVIALFQARSADGVGTRFIAAKLPNRAELARSPDRARKPARDTDLGECLAILRRYANLDLPCPTNSKLAQLLKLRSDDAARYLVGRLAEEGHIRVERRGDHVTRVITITETGKSTSRQLTPVGGRGVR